MYCIRQSLLEVTLLVSQRPQLSKGCCSPALVAQPLFDFQALAVELSRLGVVPLILGDQSQLMQRPRSPALVAQALEDFQTSS